MDMPSCEGMDADTGLWPLPAQITQPNLTQPEVTAQGEPPKPEGFPEGKPVQGKRRSDAFWTFLWPGLERLGWRIQYGNRPGDRYLTRRHTSHSWGCTQMEMHEQRVIGPIGGMIVYGMGAGTICRLASIAE